MDLSKDTSKKIEELQVLEQHVQGFLVQKQTVQVELNEVVNALEEIRKSKGDVYRVLSGIMMMAEKESLIKELEEKKKLLDLRVQTLEKQEERLEKKTSELREEITKKL